MRIPDKLYREILKSIPISTVDVVIVRGKQFLMEKRANKPYQGKWYVPGGRIWWGEQMMKAVNRQITSLGIHRAESIEFKAIVEAVNPPNNMGIRYHTLMHVFLVRVPDYVNAEGDSESLGIKWFDQVNSRWSPVCLEMLRQAGIK